MRRMAIVLSVLFLPFMLLTGCEDSDELGTGDPACLSGLAASGAPDISASGAAETLAESEAQAMNTLDDGGSPLTARIHPALAGSGCGEAGMIFLDTDTGLLRYLDFTEADARPEAVDDTLGWENRDVGLAIDPDCIPTVLTFSDSEGLIVYRRGSAGNWTSENIAPAADNNGAGFGLKAVKTTPDGRLAVFAHAGWDAELKGYLWVYTGGAGAGWETESFDVPEHDEVFDYGLDAGGGLYAVHDGKNEFPCDPCDMDLYLSHRPKGSNWSREVVQDSKWGDPDDRFSDDATLAIGSDGAVVVAACYQQRAITGSMKQSQLRVYHRKAANDWCFEAVTGSQDGYAGGDGADFTGHLPTVFFDEDGRLLVLFHDRTQWHDSNGANGVNGQPRLALRGADGWSIETLYPQAGQTESPQPLNGFRRSGLAALPDGGGYMLGGVDFAWDTDSIYNSGDMPITYKLIVKEISVSRP